MGGQEEYASRLFSFLVPQMLVGFKEMLGNATTVCDGSGEPEKYLMTFQNYLAGVPEWSAAVVEKEGQRIRAASGCGYLEELLACVHVAHLKLLTAIRPGERSQEVQLDMPSFDQYVHNAYSCAARHLYRNTFLFERDTAPLERQKNMREVELLIQRGAMDALREGLPVEGIIRSYLAEREESEAAATPVPTAPASATASSDKSVPLDPGPSTDQRAAAAAAAGKSLTNKPVSVAVPDKPASLMSVAVAPPPALEVTMPEKPVTLSIGEESTKQVTSSPAGGVSFSPTDAVLDMGTNETKNVEVSKAVEDIEVRNANRAAAEAADADEGLLQISTEPASASTDLGVEVLA